jgi:hypothetical protein
VPEADKPFGPGSVRDAGVVAGVAVLAVPIEWMRFCSVCETARRFVADRECMSGLVGRCSQCQDERVIPFTRSMPELCFGTDGGTWSEIT